MTTMTQQTLADYHERRALVRATWRLWARVDGCRAQSTRVPGAQEARREWKRVVQSIDTATQAGTLPTDILAWAAHEVRVADVTLWLRPVVDDRLTAEERQWVERHIARQLRAAVEPVLSDDA
jgi:hypothetical protein